MLDDPKYIQDRDPSDALAVVGEQWKQLQHQYDVLFTPAAEIRNVVLGGMGGSAWYSMFVQSWPQLSVPFEVVRNYNIPRYIDQHTLFIASSYSGNTEETLSALTEAEAKHAQICVVAAGGKLADRAKEAGHPLFLVPGGIQPRMSSFYMLTALMQLFEPLGLVPKGSVQELREAGEWLSQQTGGWLATVPTAQNPTKQLAQELMGKSVAVYSGPKIFPAANKWRICLNENAKNVAWGNQLPEFNHNEFIGWSSHPVDKPYGIVELRSNLEHPRVQKRFEVTNRLLSGLRPEAHVVDVQGETVIQQLLWTANMGDFVSLYLAFLNGVDPTPVALVEKLKVALDA